MQYILIVGGTGFIGTNLVNHFLEFNYLQNYNLIIVSRTLDVTNNDSRIQYIKGDYGDEIFLDVLFNKYMFCKVIHLVSSSVPVTSNDIILSCINRDLVSTIRLLEVMRKHDCKFILFVSSGGALYSSTTQYNSQVETDACTPISSYGIIKLAIEQYIQLYNSNYGINYLILRLSNVYGEYHNSTVQGVINIAIRKAICKEIFEIWGEGVQKKDYLYVKDAVTIICTLLLQEKSNQIINLGSGHTVSLNEIVAIIKYFENDFTVLRKPAILTDVQNYCLDINKLRSVIERIQFTNINDAIYQTYLWEKSKLLIE